MAIANNLITSYRLIFTVPPSHLAQVKAAIFSAGAGRYGNAYKDVCFETKGISSFVPLKDHVEGLNGDGIKPIQVEEVKVEILCTGFEVVKKAVEEMKKAHPYGQVAYSVFKMEDL